MSEEAKWKKISSKKYQILLDGEWVTIDVPYGKIELIFDEFVGAGGLVDEKGQVTESIPTLIRSFGSVGDAVLSKFSSKGELEEKGSCKSLAGDEVPVLFEVAKDIVSNFIDVIRKMSGAALVAQTQAPEEKERKKTTKA